MQIKDSFRDLIPPLTADEYRQLEENILSDGIRDPLVLWGDILVDGHNRYKIAQEHGLPFRTVQKQFDDENVAALWIIDNQFGRRNLPQTDRMILAQKRSGIVAAMARARQSAAVSKANTENPKRKKSENFSVVKNNKTENLPADDPPHDPIITKPEPVQHTDKPEKAQAAKPKQKATKAKAENEKPIHTRAEVAKMAGVSESKLAQFEQVQKKKPELVEEIRNGNLTVGKAYQTVKREEKQAEVKKRIEEYAAVQTGTVDIAATDRKYNIIYADPPWKYWESGNKNQSSHYTTMTIDEICDLPVKDISAEDCVLFLWVTYPILQEAFRVIESWGFKYSTCGFVWVKRNKKSDTPFFGNGAWTRANSELCLLATKGHVMRLDASISQVIESPIEEHSKKPDIVREKITQLVGALPRVELFCRNPAQGWDVWGNEA